MASFRLLAGAAASLLFASLIACKPAQNESAQAPANAAPATTQAQPAPGHEQATAATKWTCGDIAVSTHFDDDSLESITLGTPERQFTLKSMANEDGARFADAAGNEFWSRPGKITFTQVGKPAVECTKARS